jgi:hypothetical protein
MPRPRRRGEGGIWGEDGARIKGADGQGGALWPEATGEAALNFPSGSENGRKFSRTPLLSQKFL